MQATQPGSLPRDPPPAYGVKPMEIPATGDVLEGVDETCSVATSTARNWLLLRRRLIVILLSAFLMVLVILVLNATGVTRPTDVVHTTWYSKDHKFRPAASPVITGTLKDGRLRLHGAQPTVR
ncbi:hypothetical protein M0805_009698 [Coniferiporia weirii]|nr:hypothetical protein M0805_009698 [Coniferiporia weirii]